ncbi:MAG: ABC transporter permease [Ottowia sp.]|uniref:ABC transporter permease n=1 Tax=Ottowia sp. TaxID=1898956 RepID=UPI003C7901EA
MSSETYPSASRARLHHALLLAPAILLLVGLFVLPSLDVARSSAFAPDFSLSNFERFFSRSVYSEVLLRTTLTSIQVAAICTIFGYPAACYIAGQPRERQFMLLFIMLLTLWMSVLIRSYAWVVLLGREGPLNNLLQTLGLTQGPVKLVYTSTASLVAMVQILLPLQIVTCVGAMTEIDLNLVKAARVLGATPSQAFWRVYFPLSLNGVVNAATIVFMLAMGFFITPALVGGRSDLLLGNLIEQQVTQLQWGFAATLAMVLVVAAFAGYLFLKAFGRMLARALGSRL